MRGTNTAAPRYCRRALFSRRSSSRCCCSPAGRAGSWYIAAEPAGFAACGAAGGKHGVLGAVEHDARFRQQRFAGLGQLDTARLAPKQLDLELGFEGTDLLTERR